MKYPPRAYQSLAVDRLRENFRAGIRKQILVMPTGAGKTATAAIIIESALRKGKRILFLAHRKELIDQCSKTLDEFGVDHGIIKGKHWRTRPELPVQVASVQTLLRRERPAAEVVVLDEAHRSLNDSNQTILGWYPDALSLGLSVGPNSWIEVRGGVAGVGWCGMIEDLYVLVMKSRRVQTRAGYDILVPVDLETRGWDGRGFVWKPVRSLIRHRAPEELLSITVGGDDLTITEEHSVYRVEPGGKARKYGPKRFARVVHRSASQIICGDVMLMDDGGAWDERSEDPVDVIAIAATLPRPEKIGVVVDLSAVTSAQFRAWGIRRAIRYVCRRGRHGHRLPLPAFLAHRDELPAPTRVYWESACGLWIDPVIRMSDWAYVLGFWLGDGWIEGNRIAFAVENAMVESFVRELKALPAIELHPKITPEPTKGSHEVRVGHMLLSAVLRTIFGERPTCKNKRIPGAWITSWPRSARMELLRGLIDSDGHESRREGGKRRFAYVTTSVDLARSLLGLLRSLGVPGSIFRRKPSKGGVIKGRQIVGGESYSVSWSYYAMIGDSSCYRGIRSAFDHDQMHFIEQRVRSVVSASQQPTYVYDVSVDGHPSFVANGVLVHNTATPWRLDGRGLGAMYETIVAPITVRECIEQNYLLPFRIYEPERPDLKNLPRTGGDFNQKALAQRIGQNPKRVGNIVENWLELGEQQRTVVFATSCEDSRDIVRRFTEAGVRAEHLDGDTNETLRDEILTRLASGETQVVSNVEVLVEGYDLPSLGCIVLARSTLSLTRYLQQIGRGSRPFETQRYCIVLDHAGCVHKLGMPDRDRNWTLEDRGKPKDPDAEPAEPITCEECMTVRPPNVWRCPKCWGEQQAWFEGLPVEVDGRLVERSANGADNGMRCKSCRSELVDLERFNDLQVRVTCRECNGRSYQPDPVATRQASETRRKAELARLEQVQRDKGFKPTWVAYAYKDLFGTWPPKEWKETP